MSFALPPCDDQGKESSHAVRTVLAWVALTVVAWPQADAAAVNGQGTWQSTLQARDLDGILSNGPEAIFDTVLNVTWLADANMAFTSGYTGATHGGVPYGTSYDTNVKWTDGRMGWDAAMTWAAQLNVHGVTGWRLPSLSLAEPWCNWSYSGSSCGVNVDTSGSELAHMFHVTLGNKSTQGPTGNLLPTRGNGSHWSSAPYLPDATSAWQFDVYFGAQSYNLKANGMYAWAVRSGDVALAVPEPQATALALAGLALAVVARRQRQQR